MNREAIMQALFGLLCRSTNFATTGRRLIWWTKVAAQPAMFLRNAGEQYMQRRTGMPAKVLMECEIWLYNKSGETEGEPPAAGLNDLIDAIDAALKPAPGFEAQTLGGLVTHCWIEGKVELHPGDLDGQAIAIVPAKILVPSFGG